MQLQTKLNQYKPLNQEDMNEFISSLINTDLTDSEKVKLLETFSEKEITQDELTYISKV